MGYKGILWQRGTQVSPTVVIFRRCGPFSLHGPHRPDSLTHTFLIGNASCLLVGAVAEVETSNVRWTVLSREVNSWRLNLCQESMLWLSNIAERLRQNQEPELIEDHPVKL